ncbi:MAG: glycosyltransferase [Chloroflexota bacterium]|nr:glycosyltransferase [Chloroflexota bacterium]
MQLSVVIPALNEEANIGELISALHEVVPSISPQYELIVVDGGSVDKTRELAKMLNTKVLVQTERGYGGALKEGFRTARGEYILTLDGDLSHSPTCIPQMWEACKRAQVVVASRYVHGGSADMPRFRRLLSKVLNRVFTTGLSLPLKDISSGFRLYRSSVVKNMELGSSDFDILEEILIKSYAQGWRIREVPFHYLPRKSGDSHVRLLKFGVAYLRTFRRMWSLRNSVLSADYDYRAFDSRIPLQRYWQRRRYKIINRMAEGARATLDIGCGSSRILSALDGAVGLDVQMSKLRYVRRFDTALVNATIDALPFRDACFDCVVCSEVIEHVPCDETLFREMSRVLEAGGRLILGTPDYGGVWWRVIERLYDLFAPGGYAEEHITRYTRRSLVEMVERHGFTPQGIEYVGRSEMILSLRKA